MHDHHRALIDAKSNNASNCARQKAEEVDLALFSSTYVFAIQFVADHSQSDGGAFVPVCLLAGQSVASMLIHFFRNPDISDERK
jgi:hypothetical protein